MPRSRSAVRLACLVAGLVTAAGLVTVSTPSPASAVEPPSNLAATDAPIPVLSWDRVTGATGYDVELSSTSEFTSATRLGSVVSTTNVRYVPTIQLPTDLVWWRVRAKVGSTSGDYTIGSFTPVSSAAPVMVRPQPGVHFQAPEAPYFTWQPVGGATSYTVQTARDPLFTDPAGISESKQKTTAAYLTSYPTPGTYYWRVRAELSSGYWSPWSDSRPYVVDGLPAVQLSGPADTFAASVRDVVLDWEPVRGAATYQVQVNTDDEFGAATMRGSATGVVGTQWSPSSTLNNDEYYWRVRAVDASGNAAPWPATPWRLRRAWPDQPQLLHPTGTVAGSSPFFYQWTPIERASKYAVYLYDGTGDLECSFGTVHTTLAGECVPEKAGSYTWKVRAWDGSTVITDLIAQPAGTFHYTPPTPVVPAQAGTLSTSQVTGHATSITGLAALDGPDQQRCAQVIPSTCVDLRQTPVLSWDPVPGATSYKLTVAYDRELTNLVPGFSEISVTQPMYTFIKTLPDSQAGSAYFWVVQPCGQSCAPLSYPTTSFAKKTLPPQLGKPLADAVVSDDVTLDWGSWLDAQRAPRPADDTSSLATPADTEALTYTVQTSVDPTFTSGTSEATVDETSYTAPSSTYPEGYVYWRVRANDGSGNPSVWSEVRRFEKRSPRPTLVAPLGGAALGSDYTLSWDALPFAKGYDLEVYSGPTRVANVSDVKYTSWAPSDPLPVSTGAYTWQVRRVDASGRRGEWTSFGTFRMDGFPVAVAGPDEGALVPPTGALFSWLPDARATSYKLERRKPDDPTNALAETVTTRATAWAPTSALAAGTAQWRVIALDAAGKELGSSPWRTFVVVDPPATSTPVSISGSGKVGEDLLVSAPVFDPPSEATTYQWYRGTSTISGATGQTYTVTSSDVDKAITVRATGVLTGYKSASSTSNAITGATGDALVPAYPPVIEGEPRVGVTLGVTPGVWPDSPRLTYQWFRDGEPISRATQSTYKLTSADVDREVHVVETAAASGRSNGTAASEPVVVDPAGTLSSTAPPTLSGTPKVGQRLTASTGSWNTSAAYSYRWLRNGTTIGGATSSRYTLTPADAGRRVQVVVVATAAGWSSGTAQSKALTVARVPSTTSVALSRTRATTRQRVVATVTVAASGLRSPTGTVTVYDGTRRLASRSLGTGTSVKVTLPLLRAGAHTIRVVYSGGPQVIGSRGSSRLTVTR